MSIEATIWAWKQTTRPTCKLVLIALADNSIPDGECQIPIDYLAQCVCVTRSSIFSAINHLEKTGLVTRRQGRGEANTYRLRMETAPQ